MKRSEMILKLEAFLRELKTTGLKQVSNEILDFLESEGMAPPEIETEFYDRANCDYHRVHEWEDEDNTEDDDNYCGAV